MVPKMWSGVPPEEVLAPEPALPSQFYEVWHRSRAIGPEKALVLSVIWQSILDIRKHRYAVRRHHQRLYMEAYRWVAADDPTWPYSFVNICDMLNLTSESVRAELLGDVAPAPGAPVPFLPPKDIEEAA